MQHNVALSVVIPTYNRRRRLARVFDALDRQVVGPRTFEVVVVDDGSTDDTAAWLAAQSRSYELSAIRQANGGPARARNAGVEAARAPLILFLDDDVEPAPKLVEEHLRSHREEQRVVVMGPMSSLPHYDQPWVAWEQDKLEAQYTAMVRGDWEPTFRQFWTGNASLAKEEILAAGGFNASYTRAEDVELGLRLHQRGLQFRFNPDALGLHHAERSLQSWENVQRSYGKLEVEIFEGSGDDALVGLLGGNWSRLHPLSKFLVRHCAGKPRRQAVIRSVLEGWLERGAAAHAPAVSGKVCSVLSHLLYWQASLDALGPDRAKRVISQGNGKD
jgi:glycosyltransferase involved in cell wall biosynthesis